MVVSPLNAILYEQHDLLNKTSERALLLDMQVIEALQKPGSIIAQNFLDGKYRYVLGHPEMLTHTLYLKFILDNNLSGMVNRYPYFKLLDLHIKSDLHRLAL